MTRRKRGSGRRRTMRRRSRSTSRTSRKKRNKKGVSRQKEQEKKRKWKTNPARTHVLLVYAKWKPSEGYVKPNGAKWERNERQFPETQRTRVHNSTQKSGQLPLGVPL